VLRIENLTVESSGGHTAVRSLNLEVRAGEILGIAGVDGNGQGELVASLAGLLPVKEGRIFLCNRDITRESVRGRNEAGFGLVPEDRHRFGLVLDFRIDENFILKNFRNYPYSSSTGFLRFNDIASHAESLIEQFDIRSGRGGATVTRSMSGGNQQKVIIAREIDSSPALLVVSQPTRGLDVGAIEYIHRRIVEERDKGRAILLVSFELEEILGLCDRIAAISRGSIAGIVDAQDADERSIGAMMGS
jgi:simple sugar transport system ATP-binding protein